MHKYKFLGKKGEGTFSEVVKAQVVKTGKYVAIKRMKTSFDSIEQVNNLREIQALRRLSPNVNIVKLQEVLYDQSTGRLALVFELMDMNIYELIRGRRTNLPDHRVKSYMYQLMKSMDHMHRNGIFHRDIKPENILIRDETKLKLADFGSCRGIYSKQPYTEYISTRWYRAPECLLTDGYYNYKMDIWGVGCVFFEIMTRYPLFPGKDELDQIEKIHKIMGTPPRAILDKFKRHSSGHISFDFAAQKGKGLASLLTKQSKECVDLLQNLLAYNPDDRYTARQALRHPYFRDLYAADQQRKAAHGPGHDAASSSKPPPFAINPASLSPGALATHPQPPLPQLAGPAAGPAAASQPMAMIQAHLAQQAKQAHAQAHHAQTSTSPSLPLVGNALSPTGNGHAVPQRAANPPAPRMSIAGPGAGPGQAHRARHGAPRGAATGPGAQLPQLQSFSLSPKSPTQQLPLQQGHPHKSPIMTLGYSPSPRRNAPSLGGGGGGGGGKPRRGAAPAGPYSVPRRSGPLAPLAQAAHPAFASKSVYASAKVYGTRGRGRGRGAAFGVSARGRSSRSVYGAAGRGKSGRGPARGRGRGGKGGGKPLHARIRPAARSNNYVSPYSQKHIRATRNASVRADAPKSTNPNPAPSRSMAHILARGSRR